MLDVLFRCPISCVVTFVSCYPTEKKNIIWSADLNYLRGDVYLQVKHQYLRRRLLEFKITFLRLL